MAKKSSKKGVKKQQKELQPEVWDIRKAYGKNQVDAPQCMSDNCTKLAVACWFSSLNPDEDWNCCEACQKGDFGGWPPEFVRDEDETRETQPADPTENIVEEASDETNMNIEPNSKFNIYSSIFMSNNCDVLFIRRK